jgi:ATP-binding cassette subfamily B (MDR/TAP) protein 1
MSVPLGDNPSARHPDPIVDGAADTHPNASSGNVIREELNHEGATINSGLPFPSAVGNANIIPNLNTVSAQTLTEDEKSPQATSSRNASGSHEKPLAPSSTNSSTKEKITPQSEVKAKKGFFGRKSKKDEEDKKDKQKEEEADAVPPVSFFGLYRYATWYEKIFNVIGIIFACAAGAAQPLMTLIFGRLTQSFNEFGQTTTAISKGEAPFSALAEAQARLKTDSGHNALYLLAIGVGMFLTTWLYMYIWSVTGELNSKRIREKYLASVLRQEVSFILLIFINIFRKDANF